MKIVRYTHRGNESFGVLKEDSEIIDLLKLSKLQGRSVPSNIDGLISLGSDAESLLKELVDDLLNNRKEKVVLKQNTVHLKAPVVNPPKIICLGLNYKDHVKEAGAVLPNEPIIFMKPRTAIIGPDDAVVKPRFVNELDYEVEMAAIIGKKGKNIPISEAKEFIFGYTVFNDISARDIQFKDKQWTRGKSFDTFAPIGPCIVTNEQLGDSANLRLQTRVNGEIRQNSSTSLMLFNVYEVIYHLSRVMTLEPCDIIATGTPGGVAAFMKPERKFLKLGDTVEVEVEKIGILRNKIQEEKIIR